MKICFWGKGDRAVRCLQALVASDNTVVLVVGPRGDEALFELAKRHGIASTECVDANERGHVERLRTLDCDLSVLAGFGGILSGETLSIPRLGTINLHGGRLPEYRGSSPMNWALINGEKELGLTVIAADAGVDTGGVLVERLFPIGPDDTIADLHATANAEFPTMMLQAIELLGRGIKPSAQEASRAAYYPLRFPEDGFILFDRFTAEEIHNRVRALTLPYPCAFTLYDGRRVNLVASRLEPKRQHGEPGRIYAIRSGALLIAALDRCLWLTDARFEDGTQLAQFARRYDKFATVREAAYRILSTVN